MEDEPSGHHVPARVVRLALGGSDAEQTAQAFTLKVGEVLRVGRATASDLVLALDGVSTCHLELFLKGGDCPPQSGKGSAPPGIFVRDVSKNGTAVRPSADEGGAEAKWRTLPRGGLAQLGDGWRLLLPAKGRPASASEGAHTLTVYVDAVEEVAKTSSFFAEGASAIKQKAPKLRENLNKRRRRRAAGVGVAALPGEKAGVRPAGAVPFVPHVPQQPQAPPHEAMRPPPPPPAEPDVGTRGREKKAKRKRDATPGGTKHKKHKKDKRR